MPCIQIFFLILCLLLIGCSLFKTRTPEEPSSQSSSFVPPRTPDNVIENLINSVHELNTENYVACFVDSTFSNKQFIFQPTQSTGATYGTIFREWNLQSERYYFGNMVSKVPNGSQATLQLTSSQLTIESDSAVYTATYTLDVEHNVVDIPKIAKGNLIFILSLDNNHNWAIYRWIDNQTGTDFSWSELKAKFGS